MKRLFRFSMIFLMIFAFSHPALAQDESPAEDNPGVPVEVIEDTGLFLEDLLESIATLVYLPFAGTLVFALTAVSKKVLGFDVRLQSLTWSVVVWLVYIIAARAGYATQFESLVPALATVVATFAGVVLTPSTAGFIYDRANEQNIPVLGTPQSE